MTQQIYQWAVVGAGPAGIAAVGKLLDRGIKGSEIVWVDPEFKVGDLGRLWQNVSSNTRAGLFSKFLDSCESFGYQREKPDTGLRHLDEAKTCLLRYAVEPLQWVTERLRQQVSIHLGKVASLAAAPGYWKLQLQEEGHFLGARQVILAHGSEPRQLAGAQPPIIPLTVALDPEQLQQQVPVDQVVAVFGSSHSAMIALRLLLESGVKQVVNFYRSPLRYAVYLDQWILFDNTGLKGEAAMWAREEMPRYSPHRLLRVQASLENIQRYLPECGRAVHTVGFQRRPLPVEGLEPLAYNARSGIIAPGLFGFGIAFPEEVTDRLGNCELNVGLWKFMQYLDRVLPIWLQYGP